MRSDKARKGRRSGMDGKDKQVQDFQPGGHSLCPVENLKSTVSSLNFLK